MNELKPCPFCGKRVQLNGNITNEKAPFYFFACHGCGAAVNFPRGETAERLLEQWNRRVGES